MSMWTAIVVIVAITTIAKVVRGRTRLQARDLERSSSADSAVAVSLGREVADLRKRLEVLERIITDNRESHRLAQEIEALRDR